MRSDTRPWIWAAVVFLITFAGGFLFYTFLTFILAEETSSALIAFRQDFLFVLLLLFVTPAILAGLAAALMVNRYVRPVEKLSDISSLLGKNTSLPEYSPSGITFIDRLGQNLDAAAKRLNDQESEMQEQLRSASRKLSRERDTLATIIEQLQEGLVVTNKEGRILLFNAPAEQMLSLPDKNPPTYLGLGRPLDQVIENAPVQLAIDESRHPDGNGSFRFTVSSPGDQLLQIRAIPASLKDDPDSGNLFFIRNITGSVLKHHKEEEFADDGIRRVRDSVAGIRAAADNLKNYPDAGADMQEQFLGLILNETETIAALVGDYQKEQGKNKPGEGLNQVISLSALLGMMQRISAQSGLNLSFSFPEDEPYVEADACSVSISLLYMTGKIKELMGDDIRIASESADEHHKIKISWTGEEPDQDQLQNWIGGFPEFDGIKLPFSMQTVMQQHRAEWWTQSEDGSCEFNMILPKAEKPASPKTGKGHFDFDLFQFSLSSEIAKTPLKKITATVFDTETTGLYPSDGDRLISVGAVRILNGKLRENQSFHHYINPGRPIPEASTRIHGITDEMVAEKPNAAHCLKDFYRFCEEDIFIAHNAAFDMRFLELEQRGAGVDFSRPVIDTLLLSTILHPNLEGHSIDDLATRYGIKTETRHQALGDAIMTARVFLKMIPLLAGINIHTIEDATRASRESVYAKIRY